VKYEKAAECLKTDREALLTFYDFPARQLEALANHEPDSKHVRNRAPSRDPVEGLPIEPHRAHHGFQACRSRAEKLATPGRPQPVAKTHSRCEIYRRLEVVAKPANRQPATAAA